jgi:LacI family transcriptional regulator
MAGGPSGLFTAAERLAGFRDGLRAAGLPFLKALTSSGPFAVETGLRAARKFMRATRPPDAIVAANNRVLLGVLRALQEAGHDARQVAVAGFDGVPFAGLLGRPIVVAEQPRREIGRRAAELLVGRVEGSVSGKPREIMLQTTIRSHDPDSGPYELGV